jgi:hypothetical protein
MIRFLLRLKRIETSDEDHSRIPAARSASLDLGRVVRAQEAKANSIRSLGASDDRSLNRFCE